MNYIFETEHLKKIRNTLWILWLQLQRFVAGDGVSLVFYIFSEIWFDLFKLSVVFILFFLPVQ